MIVDRLLKVLRENACPTGYYNRLVNWINNQTDQNNVERVLQDVLVKLASGGELPYIDLPEPGNCELTHKARSLARKILQLDTECAACTELSEIRQFLLETYKDGHAGVTLNAGKSATLDLVKRAVAAHGIVYDAMNREK